MEKKRKARPTVQLQKLESLGILAGGVAHDLNNILTGILGHITCLRLSVPDNKTLQDSLNAIEDGARRATTMTQQILGFVRDERRVVEPVNLEFVVSAAVNLLRAAIPANVAIEVLSDGDERLVTGDESQLGQLVMNLLVNARDALPEGGKISVEMGGVKVNKESRDLPEDLEPGSYVILRVTDNGMGIPPHLKERIFEPFFTTKLHQGTGLGLATVYSIVQAHQGVIEVRSEVGKGSSFEVFLPQYLRTPALESIPRGRECILVVDDEETVRMSIQRSLEHLGYEVEVAKSGEEAVTYFKKAATRYDLVILDMMMPQMPGEEVFQKLREIDSGARVLIASGYASERRTRQILQAGGRGFIQKPFLVEELAREVRRCLDGEKR